VTLLTLPRLDRDAALTLSERRHLPLDEIRRLMPDFTAQVWFSPVGGARITEQELERLRDEVVQVAAECGMPERMSQTQQQLFEARCARVVRERLPLSEHEASHEEVWSYVTCCWLMDVATWRWSKGGEGPDSGTSDRYVGHINRNTFRRMWWREQTLGKKVDLTHLGEDQIVSIMERPTLTAHPDLARSIATTFLEKAQHANGNRSVLMREATKRILRLTPFVTFEALDPRALDQVVADAFDAALAGMRGEKAAMRIRLGAAGQPADPSLVEIPAISLHDPADEPSRGVRSAVRTQDFEEVAQAALLIARRTGQVTNMSLREVVPSLSPEEAREVFRALMERGDLARRGVRRGTHYVLNEEVSQDQGPGVDAPAPPPAEVADRPLSDERPAGASVADERPQSSPGAERPAPRAPRSAPPSQAGTQETIRVARQGAETALRRLLRRRS